MREHKKDRVTEFRARIRDEGAEERRHWLGVKLELCGILEAM